MSKMVKRILVAAVILPLLVLIIFANNVWFFIGLAVIVLTMALNEIYNMLDKKGMKTYKAAGIIFNLLLLEDAVAWHRAVIPFLIFAFFIITLFLFVIGSKNVKNLPKIFYTAAPVVYIGGLGSFGIHLRLMENGVYWIFLLLLLTLVYDGGAYFVGSAIGKHKLIPELSPAKTVEGCAGGVAVNIITVVIIYFTFLPGDLMGPHTLIHVIALAVILSFFGQAGDISASIIKRYVGVKNSSNLLPEHGGVLDKIDSALFNAPVLYLYIMMLMWK